MHYVLLWWFYEVVQPSLKGYAGIVNYADYFVVCFQHKWGAEQFHGAPADQWTVITKIIDECDFYLLIVGGRYGSIDETVGVSYTEKEYDYAKARNLPILVLIKNPSFITEDKKDTGDEKYELMERLDDFRNKVKTNGNTVDFFDNLEGLKYSAGATLRNAVEYANDDSGWVRYKDIMAVINEEAEGRNKANVEIEGRQQKLMEEMKNMLSKLEDRISDIENNQLTWEEIPTVSKEDIDNLFKKDMVFDFGNEEANQPTVGQDDVGNIPVDSAFLLVYAADGDGQIMKIQTLGSHARVYASGKRFMADDSKRESARWVEALDRLIAWGWVKTVGYKGQIFELTGTGYEKADWLKYGMGIDTTKDPLEELQEFN